VRRVGLAQTSSAAKLVDSPLARGKESNELN
jgi:hypothetical protein